MVSAQLRLAQPTAGLCCPSSSARLVSNSSVVVGATRALLLRRTTRTPRSTARLEVKADAGATELGKLLLKIDNTFEELGLGAVYRKFEKKSYMGLYLATVLFVADGACRTLEGVPLLPPVFQLVGLLFTSWFVTRNIVPPERREESKAAICSLLEQIYLPGMAEQQLRTRNRSVWEQQGLEFDASGIKVQEARRVL